MTPEQYEQRIDELKGTIRKISRERNNALELLRRYSHDLIYLAERMETDAYDSRLIGENLQEPKDNTHE